MGKVNKPASPKKPKKDLPDHLTMKLFAPGMTLLHRAGLGGLACTLKTIERQYEDGLLAKAKLPAPFDDDKPPWEITNDSITLYFGAPENAEKYLKHLFEYAFSIGQNDGLIRLPGQYYSDPATAVLADLQQGLTLTFLQHGKVRQLSKESTTVSYDPTGDGIPGVEVTYRKCSGFKHQEGWQEFIESNGCLTSKTMRLDGPISPGTVVRHVAFTGPTAAEDPPERILPVYFALVGCIALSVNRGVAALLVPEVEDLLEFVWDRPAMTPTTVVETQVANAADAGLQAQRRLHRSPTRTAHIQSRSRALAGGSSIAGMHVMTFTPTAWASQQKSRIATIHVPLTDNKLLDRFERALANLPLRVVPRTVKESTGRGKNKVVVERQESFRAESVVRPIVAENLALGRPWYSGFIRLMTKTNPATDKPYRNQLPFERKGLHAMISDPKMWDEKGEALVVQAVHSALRGRYGQIANENKSNPVAMKNRFNGEYDRWRLAFAGSKTPDQFRKALCDLFSRAGRNEVLQQEWQEVLPMLRTANWQHARDLALLALCSYQGRGLEPGTELPESQ